MYFSPEQDALRDAIRKMVEKEIAPLAAEVDETDELPDRWTEVMGEMGLLQMWVPEEYGGPGGDLTSVCIAKEETAKASLAASALCANNSIGLILPLLHFGTEEQKKRYLAESASGKILTSVAISEPQAGSDVSATRTTARRQSDGSFVINGQKSWVTWGEKSKYILVFAKTSEGDPRKSISSLIVDTSTPGFRVGSRERKMGRHGAPSNTLFFDDVVVPPDALVGEEGTGFSACMKILDLNRPTIAASALGLAQAAFDMSVAYCKERQVYGKPIGQFEGMQFKLADMAMKIEAARHLLYGICAEIDSGDLSRLQMASSIVKCYVSDISMEVAVEAVQIFGANGYSKEYPLERIMRDAKLNQIIEGTNEIHRMIIGRTLVR